jgi:hypothetical protein
MTTAYEQDVISDLRERIIKVLENLVDVDLKFREINE